MVGKKEVLAAVVAVTLSQGGLAFAQAPAPPQAKPLPGGSQSSASNAKYDELFEQYLSEARKMSAPATPWMMGLMADPRARNINDLLTIRIEENVTASGSADSTLGKKSAASVDFPSPVSKGIAKVLPNGSDTSFNGSGSTTRSSAINALLTARVSEVLPNGDLVIEGIREVDVNGDRQVVVLTGVVRAVDVAPNNSVSSTLVGQLRIRSIGRGLIKDSLSPGWLMRILNKIF
ncbi:MAG: flagellar basal body L-ring protein FlgH [Acidobacteria bacterium]|nr:flagellar basal body L-ring protein FlgH [Acidobacteriota bacterium]